MTSIADYSRKNLDKSLFGVMDALAGDPVFRSLTVRSGYRDPARNKGAGGAKKSQHLRGKALDIDVSRLSNAQKKAFLDKAIAYGVRGVGIYSSGNSIHIDARRNAATWGSNPKDKYAGVKVSQQPKWARESLNTMFSAGPFKAFPAAPVSPAGAETLAAGPAGASLAESYRTARYQRAMPAARPGGLGALRQAATGLTTASAMPTPPDSSQAIAQRAMERSWAGQTLADMRSGQNMPVDPRHPSIANFASIEKPAAPIPGAPNLGETIPARPGSIRAPQREGSLGSLLSSFPTRPAGPIAPMPAPAARTMPTVQQPDPAVMAGFKQALAQDKTIREVGPTQRFSPGTVAPAPPSSFPARPAPSVRPSYGTAAPTPTVRPDYASPQQRMAPTVADVMRSPVSPVGPYATATGPVAAAAPAFNPDRVKDDVIASTPAAAAQTLQTTPEIAFDTPAPAPAGTPAQAAVKAQAATRPQGIPGGIAGPWGADIGNRRASTGVAGAEGTAGPWGADISTQTPTTTFGQKLGNFAQRNIPAIAGGLIAGPVGGLIGGVLGRAFDNAQPGQMLGNPFQGLGGSLKALGMFQSGTPYAGPVSHYGTGLRAISDVLGGQAPVGSRAYSRSTPGYSVTSLPNGMVQRTNQYGFTSFERPSTGPTASSFPGGFSAGPGGVFGGGGRKSEKSEKSSGRSSGGGATGHSKSSRY